MAEHHSYRCRSDLEVYAGKNIYIIEFKDRDRRGLEYEIETLK